RAPHRAGAAPLRALRRRRGGGALAGPGHPRPPPAARPRTSPRGTAAGRRAPRSALRRDLCRDMVHEVTGAPAAGTAAAFAPTSSVAARAGAVKTPGIHVLHRLLAARWRPANQPVPPVPATASVASRASATA